MVYYFSDYGGQAIVGGKKIALEYSIKDEDYLNLIETCFRYSSYFSLVFTDKSKHLSNEPIPLRINVSTKAETRFYKCNEENKKFLLSLEQDLLEWRGIYQNLCFYRADGTILFWSETHEGMCTFKIKEGENISNILNTLGWHKYEDKVKRREDEKQKFVYSYYEEAKFPNFLRPHFDFEKFIFSCLQYCTHFSLTFSNTSQIPSSKYTPYHTEIVGNDLIKDVYFNKMFYEFTEETLSFILPIAKKHFLQKYDITSPDTIIFYRADGTEFLSIDPFAPILSISPEENMDEFLSDCWIKNLPPHLVK